ncbi:regulator of g-protein signaling hypothetical protein [Limosa lapponica baueri]|uniref:Uncharacterized protein n=1 Tax=Limosa lapponica baueri TaxID=1758121 RepID=A0A2I0THX1_LIMLA|nr:regulator of g-protein signaling hypothetical protein [Limosa lapponica baueri]
MIEDIITRMQDDKTGGVPIRTVKSFLSKIPSVVTGVLAMQLVSSHCKGGSLQWSISELKHFRNIFTVKMVGLSRV